MPEVAQVHPTLHPYQVHRHFNNSFSLVAGADTPEAAVAIAKELVASWPMFKFVVAAAKPVAEYSAIGPIFTPQIEETIF